MQGDSDPPATVDRQIGDYGGGFEPKSKKGEGGSKPSALCPTTSAFQGGSLGKTQVSRYQKPLEAGQSKYYSHDEVALSIGNKLTPSYIKKKANEGNYPELVTQAGFTRYVKFKKGRKRSECGWLKD